MNNLQFVSALHGDEIVPIGALLSQGIKPFIGNPRAYVQRKRFIDSDLNSAFGKGVIDYETTRAAELLRELDTSKKVIDFHTFTRKSPPFVIIVDPKMLSLAQKTGITRVVYMKHNVKAGGALINHRSGISVEVGQHKNWSSYEITLKVLDSLRQNRSHDVELYEVYDVIKDPGSYINFHLYKNQFYPVLSSKNYHGSYGLKARKINQEEL